jgi:hypothetical protein
MFDLFRSREKATRYLLGGLLFAVAASMVITLIPGFGSNTGTTTGTDPTILAEIGNEKLSGQEAQAQFQQVTNQPNINPDMLAAYFPQFVEQMIMQRAALYEAERMGLTVTDDELLVGLQSQVPQAFQNGGVDKAVVEQYYVSQGQTVNDGLDGLRKQLIVRKLENSTLQGVVVAPKEVEDEYRKKYERAKVIYIAFPGAKFMEQIKPNDAALKDYLRSTMRSTRCPRNSITRFWFWIRTRSKPLCRLVTRSCARPTPLPWTISVCRSAFGSAIF